MDTNGVQLGAALIPVLIWGIYLNLVLRSLLLQLIMFLHNAYS